MTSFLYSVWFIAFYFFWREFDTKPLENISKAKKIFIYIMLILAWFVLPYFAFGYLFGFPVDNDFEMPFSGTI